MKQRIKDSGSWLTLKHRRFSNTSSTRKISSVRRVYKGLLNHLCTMVRVVLNGGRSENMAQL